MQQQRIMRSSVLDTCGLLGCSLAVMALLSAVPGGEAFLYPMTVKSASSSPGGVGAGKAQQQQQRLVSRSVGETGERAGESPAPRAYFSRLCMCLP